MRKRPIALASLVSGLMLATAPMAANAAQRHEPVRNNGLTIAATPQSIIAGEGVMVYGQLQGSDVSGQTIKLYHRIAGQKAFTVISTTTTNTDGFYEFTRAEGIVDTDRSWFVTAPGVTAPTGTVRVHSRTVHEHVAALVSLSSSAASGDTSDKFTFSGSVAPNHTGGHVVLEEQTGVDGNHWKKLVATKLTTGSDYSVGYRFKTAGDYTLRAFFAGDVRNTAASSTPVTVDVTQAQVSDFTIASSSPSVVVGGSDTISGTLYQAGTTTPDAGASVALWARVPGGKFKSVGTPVLTAIDGSYSFAVMPENNTIYQVRTTVSPVRSSATEYVGVQDLITPNSVPSTATVGQAIKFTGSVSPDKAGHVIYLERLGADGKWHVVEVKTISHNSTYSLGWKFGHAGTDNFRVALPGGPANIGSVTAESTITVSLPPVSTLPAGS